MHSVETLDEGYTSTSKDPYFEYTSPDTLQAGWYEISVRVSAMFTFSPKVYFDFGNGYTEDLSSTLYRRKSVYDPNLYTNMLFLQDAPQKIRFDPLESKGAFQFEGLEISSLGFRKKAKFIFQKVASIIDGEPIKNRRRLYTAAKWFVSKGTFYGFSLPSDLALSNRVQSNYYKDWIVEHDYNPVRDKVNLKEAILNIGIQPLISIIVPVYNAPVEYLDEMILSCLRQVYSNWELCIADDKSSDKAVLDRLLYWQNQDDRIKVTFRNNNGHISEASNTAVSMAKGTWLALLDHDDLLPAHALATVVDSIAKYPDARMFYSDEDKIDISGFRKEPYFKSDWNYYLFLSQNMFSHLGVYETTLFEEAGGFRKGFEGAQDYDLALRCIEKVDKKQIKHIPHVLYHWRQLPGSTSLDASEKPYAMLAGERALQEHLHRTDQNGTVKLIGHGYEIDWEIPQEYPKVSIIIPTRDSKDLLETCITSILEKTTYPEFEILVIDNQSSDPETIDYFNRMQKMGIKILPYDDGFNFSAICNHGVKHCNSDYILFLNNDTEISTVGWLGKLMGLACKIGVGAVGARLWYPDDTLQHAGLVLSPFHIAMNQGKGNNRNTHGYFGRTSLTHSSTAVTAACMLVKKSKFLEVSGFNETSLAIAYNDVDFCLKLFGKGYTNVCMNSVDLYHHESATRSHDDMTNERYRRERAYILSQWGHLLDLDPNYNPNLTILSDNFSLADQPRTHFFWRD